MSSSEEETNAVLEINLPGTAASDFGDDELGQIRNLLFGKHARQTLDRIDRVEEQLLQAIQELQDQVDQRFNELEARLTDEVEVRTSVATNLVTRIDEEAKARRDAQIDLRTEFDRRSTEARKHLMTTRGELTDRIESVDADLRERNVDREALASLFERAATNLTAAEG